ncbi:unnamed protein product [Urochloa humidicola]
MGSAGKWLRSFLPGTRGGRDKATPAGGAPAADPSDLALALALAGTAVTTPASRPGAKEKRLWSFRRQALAASQFAGLGFARHDGVVSSESSLSVHGTAVAI